MHSPLHATVPPAFSVACCCVCCPTCILCLQVGEDVGTGRRVAAGGDGASAVAGWKRTGRGGGVLLDGGWQNAGSRELCPDGRRLQQAGCSPW